MAPFSVLRFIKEQRKVLPSPVQVDLTGKTAIVTGGNVGLGYEVVKHLATLKPAKLIIACRTVQKGEDAAAKITAETGTNVEIWKLDLADLKQTQAFGERCLTELDRLDIFIANAGVNTNTPVFTADGFETTLQTNNIANSLLCAMLIPLLRKTASSSIDSKPHLTIVGSDVHYAIAKLPGSDEGIKMIATMNESFKVPGFAGGATRYNESKTVNYFNTQDLARLAGDSVTVNVVSPGLCWSNLGGGNGFIAAGLFTVMRTVFARSTEVGSRCITWAALADTPSGIYSESMGIQEASDYVISEKGKKDGEAIWEELQEIWKEKVGWSIQA